MVNSQVHHLVQVSGETEGFSAEMVEWALPAERGLKQDVMQECQLLLQTMLCPSLLRHAARDSNVHPTPVSSSVTAAYIHFFDGDWRSYGFPHLKPYLVSWRLIS